MKDGHVFSGSTATRRRLLRYPVPIGRWRVWAVLSLIWLLAGFPGRTAAGSAKRSPTMLAGFRSSRYGINPFPDPDYWVTVAQRMAHRMGRADPGGIWIVSSYDGETGGSILTFPRPAGLATIANLRFADSDLNEAYLTAFDRHHLRIWLQVEPGNVDVSTLIDLVLTRYGHHPCIVGFGVDGEWLDTLTHPEGRAMTDAEVLSWQARVRHHQRQYGLFVKHYRQDRFPPTARRGLLFVNDGQNVKNLRELVSIFTQWSAHFRGAEVAFQVGYPKDARWWRRLNRPAQAIGRTLRQRIRQTRGIFWVDFSLYELFPG